MEVLGGADQLMALDSAFLMPRAIRDEAVVLREAQSTRRLFLIAAHLQQVLHLLLILNEAEYFHELFEVNVNEGMCTSKDLLELLVGLGEPLFRVLQVVDDGTLPRHSYSMLFPRLVHAFAHIHSHLLIETVHIVVHDLLELRLQAICNLDLRVEDHLHLLRKLNRICRFK